MELWHDPRGLDPLHRQDSPECFLGCPLYTIIPAVPGQYDLESFFGITPAPGFSFVAAVTEIH
jgi:hypothetical protein